MDRGKSVNILGVPIGAYSMDTLLARVEELIRAPGCAIGYGVNAHVLNLTYHHPEFLKALHQADLLYADGASLVLASRLLGGNIPEKLTTTDVWPRLCEIAVHKGYRFFLLGGESGLAERAASQARRKYPGLHIVGTHHGYFNSTDGSLITEINDLRVDILWVGMGDPRQLLWAVKWHHHLQVSLILTCGGMFKIVAGELDRLSHTWRQRGFEWAYRLWQEPATWRRYLIGLPLFGLRVMAQALTHAERPFKLNRESTSD